MSKARRPRCLAAALALLVAGCSSAGSLPETDREQIAATADTWRDAASERDTPALGALYTRDAVLFPEHAPAVRGRAGIEEFYGGYPAFTELEVRPVEIEGFGDLAYVWGIYSMRLTPPEAGVDPPEPSEKVPERGKFLQIWRRQEDGIWRVEREMFTSDMPLDPDR